MNSGLCTLQYAVGRTEDCPGERWPFWEEEVEIGCVVAPIERAGNRLHATVDGHVCRPRHLVKAVTLNSLEFLQRESGAWHGRVVLDV